MRGGESSASENSSEPGEPDEGEGEGAAEDLPPAAGGGAAGGTSGGLEAPSVPPRVNILPRIQGRGTQVPAEVKVALPSKGEIAEVVAVLGEFGLTMVLSLLTEGVAKSRASRALGNVGIRMPDVINTSIFGNLLTEVAMRAADRSILQAWEGVVEMRPAGTLGSKEMLAAALDGTYQHRYKSANSAVLMVCAISVGVLILAAASLTREQPEKEKAQGIPHFEGKANQSEAVGVRAVLERGPQLGGVYRVVVGDGDLELEGILYDVLVKLLEYVEIKPGDETPPPGEKAYVKGFDNNHKFQTFHEVIQWIMKSRSAPPSFFWLRPLFIYLFIYRSIYLSIYLSRPQQSY
jgi:hypothetical protein